MADKSLKFDITAEDKASKVLEEVADKAGELEDEKIEVPVGIDESQVRSQVQDVLDDLDKITRADPTVSIKVDDAAIDAARRKVQSVGDGGSEAGQRFGAQFAGDLGGVLNEQVGGVGNQLVQGLESALAAAGVSASLAGPLIAALGIGTVVAAAASTLWSSLNENAARYKQLLEDSAGIQEQIAQGDLAAANRESAKLLIELGPALSALGVGVQQAAGFMRGAAVDVGVFNDALTDDQRAAAIQELQTALDLPSWGDAVDLFDKTRLTLNGMRDGFLGAESAAHDLALATLEQAKADVAAGKSIDQVNAALLQQAEVSAPSAQHAIFEYIAEVNGIPPKKITEIEADMDPNDIAQIQHELDVITAARTVRINFQGIWDAQILAFLRAGGNLGSAILGNAAPTGGGITQNITVNAGFGTDAFAVRQAVLASAKQAARLTQNAVRFNR